MMGRIPIFINTDCVLPYWDEIEKHNFGLMINEEDIISKKINLIETIKKYYNDNKDSLTDIQKKMFMGKVLEPIWFYRKI